MSGSEAIDSNKAFIR